MLVILINWLYIGITTFLTGYAILGLFARLFEYKTQSIISYFFAGLVVVTVYAQVFSLFAGVGILANLLLSITCVGVLIYFRKDLTVLIKNVIGMFGKSKCYFAVPVFLIVFMAYGTSRGYMHFDTGLYHAQSIRWIEEYGVVPGLANLQSRFGYNSAAFALTALYSMKDVFGQSLHTTAGFFALLSAFVAMDIYKVFVEKKIRLSDFVRIGLIFYLSVIFSEMMSPASDYYAQLLLFDVLVLWLAENENQKEKGLNNPIPYGLLCILLVYAMTIKFSVIPLLLLVIKPAVMLLKKKEIQKILVFLVSGLLTILPFFARNVMISGWLIYPSTIIDLFDVDWKIPIGQAQYDAMEIGVYGKGIRDVNLRDMPISQWGPAWFAGLKLLEKLFVLATVGAIILYILLMLYKLWKKRKLDWNITLVFAVLVVGTFFWFFSAPLVRYGYAYVVAVPAIFAGFLFLQIADNRNRIIGRDTLLICLRVIIILFLLTRIKGFASDILRTYQQPYYIRQMDYVDSEAITKEVDGITFYVPTYSGQIGYEKFPSSMLILPIELRGESIEDGFRQVEEW